MKYLLLDVAGTILHKPALITSFQNALSERGIEVSSKTLKRNHKLVTEMTVFPDRTSAEFYNSFNADVLCSLGIVPSDDLLSSIHNQCDNLSWEPFDDCSVLESLDVPIGIASNFSSTLGQVLAETFDFEFSDLTVSEGLGTAKPSVDFYKLAIERTGIPAGDIVYVGDSLRLDLIPALSVGLDAYLIDRDEYYLPQERRISSLTDLRSF